MGNIITYVKTNGAQSFKDIPLGCVDSLVLSELAYNKYEGRVSGDMRFDVTLRELNSHGAADSLFSTTRVPEQNRVLFELAAESRRFSEIALGAYRAHSDEELEKQFAAITYRLDENLFYIAFRGTDGSFVGWKEDLNMAYQSPVPSQTAALSYFEELAAAYPEAMFILGGHSKGGNIAEYAAACASDAAQSRVIAVYNHDGPGFREDALNMERFNKIRGLIHKTIPESSIIGPLLEQYEQGHIIRSSAFIYLQHDPFSWLVENGDFVYSEQVSGFSLRAGKAIRIWLDETDEKTRQVFIGALYSAVSSSRADCYDEFCADFFGNTQLVIDAIKTEDPEIRQKVDETLQRLMLTLARELRREIASKTARLLSKPGLPQIPWGLPR